MKIHERSEGVFLAGNVCRKDFNFSLVFRKVIEQKLRYFLPGSHLAAYLWHRSCKTCKRKKPGLQPWLLGETLTTL